jgi:hypothetical protein
MTLVERLRLGGPNAAEVAGDAADEIDRAFALLERIALGKAGDPANEAMAFILARNRADAIDNINAASKRLARPTDHPREKSSRDDDEPDERHLLYVKHGLRDEDLP